MGSLTTWTAIAAGDRHSLALKSDGTLWAWGPNLQGQLGLGDTVSRSSTVQVGSLTTWTAIAAGKDHALALKSDGTLWAWGQNYSAFTGSTGPLGLGDVADRSSPVQVGSLTTWTAIAGGRDHTLALKSDGTLWAWGGNSAFVIGTTGQLGLGDTTNRYSPVQVGALTTWTSIAAGTTHSLALKSDGTLWAWGRNSYGRLGLGDTAHRSSPVQVGSLTTWTAIAAGYDHVIALSRSEGMRR